MDYVWPTVYGVAIFIHSNVKANNVSKFQVQVGGVGKQTEEAN